MASIVQGFSNHELILHKTDNRFVHAKTRNTPLRKKGAEVNVFCGDVWDFTREPRGRT